MVAQWKRGFFLTPYFLFSPPPLPSFLFVFTQFSCFSAQPGNEIFNGQIVARNSTSLVTRGINSWLILLVLLLILLLLDTTFFNHLFINCFSFIYKLFFKFKILYFNSFSFLVVFSIFFFVLFMDIIGYIIVIKMIKLFIDQVINLTRW